MIRCPRCGLELPSYARFCARCGARLPAPGAHVAGWVLVLFGVGTTLSAAGVVVYVAAAIDPSIGAANNLDPGMIRAGSIFFAVALTLICVIQAAAIVGLVRGREWGRIVATIACVLWSFTCVLLPVGILVLNSLWRRRPSAAL